MKIRLTIRLSHAILVALAVLLAGCGGGVTSRGVLSPATGSTTGGRATATVLWPTRGRVIPLAANAIKVTLSQGTSAIAVQTLTRPASGNTTTVTFNALPAGTLNVTASAYPNADGSGTAQATATTSIAVQASQNTPFTLSLNSTIDHLESTPASLALNAGDVTAVTVTAKDSAGHIVLIKPQTLTWLSSAPTIATVDSAGNVTGVAAGGTVTPVQVTVTETESSKSVSIPVVIGPPGVLTVAESFDYSDHVGQSLGGASGGTGLAYSWLSIALGALYIDSGSLTYSNLITSGNSVEGEPLDGPGGTTSSVGETRKLTSSLGQSGTVIYFSILLRPLDVVQTGGSNDYCGLLIGNTANSGLFVGKLGASTSYGMSSGPQAGGVSTSVSAQQNTTAFLVGRVTFKDGNDQCDLWVNPAVGKPLPANPDATKTDLDLGTVGQVSLYAGTKCQFDELRIGTSYKAVAPTQ